MPIVLLIGSNVFMTIAWYGHLKFPSAALWVAVMASWGIALVEYWLAVPANRIGYGAYTAAELKTIQEVISLTVFAGFAVFVLGEKLTWNHAVGFGLIFARRLLHLPRAAEVARNLVTFSKLTTLSAARANQAKRELTCLTRKRSTTCSSIPSRTSTTPKSRS
jgi:uncharacterized protein (DUF486 family)